MADKLGRLRVFRGTIVSAGLVQLLWPFVLFSKPLIVIFAIMYGFTCGGFIAMVPVMMANYFSVQRLGGAMGFLNFGLIPGALGGAPLAGAVRNATGGYQWAFVSAGCIMMLSSLSLLLLDSGPVVAQVSAEESSVVDNPHYSQYLDNEEDQTAAAVHPEESTV